MQEEHETNFDFEQEEAADTELSSGSGLDQNTEALVLTSASKKKLDLSKDGLIEMVKQNWLYGALGLVGIIVVWYLFTTILFPSEPAPHKAPVRSAPVTQQQWIEAPAKKAAPVAAAAPQKTAMPVVAAASIANDNVQLSQQDMKDLLQGFEKVTQQQMLLISDRMDQSVNNLHNSELQANAEVLKNQKIAAEEVKNAKEQILLLKDQITSINTKFDQYNQNLSKMSTSLANTQEQLKLLVAEKAEDAEQLTLRAVVPGRAWLVNADGRTITVIQGTSLPHYGTIVRIDSDQGKVYTSSGYVFN